MGQQQILFLIAGVCIIGIGLSAGAIALQSGPAIDHRSALHAELKKLAAEAQAYRRRPFEQDGGDGTFIGLTSTPFGIARLTGTPTTPFGEFFIGKSGNAHCVQIMAVGNSPGNDPSKPITILMTVFAEGTSVSFLN